MVDLTRRRVVKTAGAVATTAALTSGFLLTTSKPALAATGLTASDVNVSTNDGELNTLTIAPDITVSWSGQETAVAEVEVTWKVMTSSTSETTIGNTPYSFTVSDPSKSGSLSKTMSAISMLSSNGGALSASNFEATTDGGSNTTDVTISMDCTLKDASSNTITSTTDLLGPKTYAVTVTNTTSSVSGDGTANTGGS